jgi:MATE family, multidrug efflux pump
MFFAVFSLIGKVCKASYSRGAQLQDHKDHFQKNSLTSGSVSRRLFLYMIPLLIGNLAQQLYTVIDSIIVGQVVGDVGLAAIGAATPFIFLVISLLVGLGAGADILSAQFTGKQQREGVQQVADTFVSTIVIMALILGIIGAFTVHWLLKVMQTPSNVIPSAVSYLRIYFLSLVLPAMYNTFSGIIRGTGDSKSPLIFLLVSVISNIILDIVFVKYLNLGVAGAAYATCIAQALAVGCCIIYSIRPVSPVRLRIKGFTYDRDLIKQGYKMGLPITAQQIVGSVSMLIMQYLVNPFGVITVAAFAVGARIDSFASMPILNIARTSTIFTAQNLSAGKIQRLKEGRRSALIIGWIFSVGLTLVAWMWGGDIVSLFSDNPEVIDLGWRYLKILSPSYFLATTMFVTMGYMKGHGNTRIPLRITVLSLVFFRIPSAIILGKIYGVSGVFASLPISWCVGAVLTLFWVRKVKELRH